MTGNEEWRKHLKKFYESHDMSLKQAMIEAKKTYRPKNQPKNNHKGSGVYQDVVNVVNKMIGSKARPLKDGEYSLIDSEYTGPGTRLAEKLKNGVKPLNKTDACSMKHDIAYDEIMTKYRNDPVERAKHIRWADEEVKNCYRGIKDEPFLSNVAHAGIQIKNTFEDVVPSFIAKKVQGNYYGSKKGNGYSRGDAKRLLKSSL